MTVKYRYGDGWERFPIEEGEVWGVPENGSKVAVHDIFKPLPAFMNEADFLFVDPPWNQGNLTSFYTKAHKPQHKDFGAFSNKFFDHIANINPRICYIEIGNQFVDEWTPRLAELYPTIQRFEVVYYGKHPTNIIRGGHTAVDFDYTGMDEAKVIMKAAQVESYKVMGDLCMGQGLVGVAAYKAGKPFVGTELNKRRLANLLKKLDKLGARVSRYD